MALKLNTGLVLTSIFVLLCVVSESHGREINPQIHRSRVRAVNLGGWLVTEGWIKPSLFDAIPNKDFLVSTLNFFFYISHVFFLFFVLNSCYLLVMC